MAEERTFPYDPSLPAAITFAVLFSLTSIVHVIQVIRRRTWYFIPFLVGCLFEVTGYTCRIVSAKQTPNWTNVPVIVMTLVLLVGPALLAASIYMVLGRVIRFVDAENHSLVRTKWMTKVFVIGDVISFFTQCGGAGIYVSGTQKSQTIGRAIILTGLGLQVAFFSGFVIVTAVFNYRIVQSPTTISLRTNAPWRSCIAVLYISSGLILLRSIYRVAEFAMGREGEPQKREVFLYCFEAVPMLLCLVAFNLWHPGRVISKSSLKS